MDFAELDDIIKTSVKRQFTDSLLEKGYSEFSDKLTKKVNAVLEELTDEVCKKIITKQLDKIGITNGQEIIMVLEERIEFNEKLMMGIVSMISVGILSIGVGIAFSIFFFC